MNELEKNIYHAFSGKLVGNRQMKIAVCKVVSKFPQEIVDFVTKKCWFMASLDDAFGFTFTGNDLQDQHLIFLSDELFLENEAQIEHTIAHEIGHVILAHRNSTVTRQAKEEIKQQEAEADHFVRKYLEEDDA